MYKKHEIFCKASFKKYSSPNIYGITILHGLISYCLTILATTVSCM